MVFCNGTPHSPRGQRTLEILNFTSTIDMERPVVTIPGRKMGHKFQVAEALWILGGSNRADGIVPYSRAIKEFSDDGYRFQGAYGPMVGEQLRYVCETLFEDNATRQAIIVIWRANPRKSRDIPCTVSLQFLIRGDRIHCVANMRSSDLWLGWVYDVFNFTMITAWVTLRLREMGGLHVKMGNLYLNAGSQHIYERNFDAVRNIFKQDDNTGINCSLDISQFNDPSSLECHLYALRDTLGVEDNTFMSEITQLNP